MNSHKKTYQAWTDYETSLLRRRFPTDTWEELHTRLPRHDVDSIKRKAARLGLKRGGE